MDKVVVLLLLAAQISKGCFPEPRQSRSFKSNNHGKYITLNEGQLWASKPNLSIGKGQSLFGRLTVPWSSEENWTLEVSAHWSGHFTTTPLWLYIKRAGLPSTNDYDRTGVSFVSRQFSRVRVHDAEAGPYFIMVEALRDLRNVTLELNILGHQEEERRRFHIAIP